VRPWHSKGIKGGEGSQKQSQREKLSRRKAILNAGKSQQAPEGRKDIWLFEGEKYSRESFPERGGLVLLGKKGEGN